MPIYEYQCQSCSRRNEVMQRLSDPRLETCEECGGALRKLISAPAFQFKGSGWYVTDYARKGGDKDAKGTSKDDSGDSGKSSDAASSSSGGSDAGSSSSGGSDAGSSSSGGSDAGSSSSGGSDAGSSSSGGSDSGGSKKERSGSTKPERTGKTDG